MTLQALTPMLRTWDLPGSIAFYTAVLGFECERTSEEWGWASLRRDDVAIMLARPDLHAGETAAAFTGSFYLKTDEVDSLWADLKDRVRICYPIETFDYGMREFAIYDNNGYVLQFGQPLPAARQP
jgi:uncharacterized glyoxalase superfamily protein PhnB